MNEPIRVLLVDDDPLVRAGLGLMLGGRDDLTIVGEAVDGDDALVKVPELRPDVVLMDVRMPNRDGLSATEQILKDPDPPRIVVLTTFDADDLVLRALRAGAQGFLLKDTPAPRMVEAIKAAAAGEPTLSPRVATAVIAAATSGSGAVLDRQRRARDELAALTDREREVAVEIARGRSNAEIAADAYMSVATVKSHITRILAKLGLENRVQVAMKVHDAGLV